MNFTRKIGFIFVFLTAVFFLFSCDGSQPFKDLRAYVENLKQKKVEPSKDDIVRSREEAEPASVKYEAEKRRSPFEILDVAPAKGVQTTNPLQAYPLDMLRFVGTVSQQDKTSAFISAPNNKIYQVKVGDVLGDRDSRVVSIESDRISLMEEYSENGSAPIKRVVTLQLKEAN